MTIDKKYDEEGRLLIRTNWFLPQVISDLKSQGQCYTYFRGKKITSDMSEDEIYAITYGSKEIFDRKYPKGYSEASLEIAKNEVLFAFLAVAPPDIVQEHLEVLKKEGKCKIDYNLGEYLLALANGVPFDDILVSIKSVYDSGYSFTWLMNTISKWSLRGNEFLEYYKSVDPEEYNFYFTKDNGESHNR